MEKFVSVFFKKQTSVGGAAVVLASMVLTSRVLGLVRDRLLAARFTPEALGVYFAAFRLPNLIFELLVMGALTSAFIPVFTKYLAKDKAEAWYMSSTIINVTVLIFLLFMIPLLIWTPAISRLLAPGFDPSQIDQMAGFTRFMILFQVIPLLIGNFFTGILQSFHLFLIPAVAPVVYNVGIIVGIYIFTPIVGLWAPVLGVGIGAFLFMFIQIPLLVSLGYRYKFVYDPKHPGVREVGKLMAPRTFGLAVSQIDTTVDLILSSLLGARMVTIFSFAQHLQQLPVGLFGATVAQAALPSLSLSSIREDHEQFKKTIIDSLNQILFFVLPISVLFIVLRIPIIRLVFGATQFDWSATVLTSITLSTFSISLFAQATIHILARAFYALYDSKTPVFVGICAIVINTVLSLLFISLFHLPVWSLGLSASFASVINAFFLLILLDRRIHGLPRRALASAAMKMLLASGIMGVMLYIPLKLLDQLVFDTTRTFGLLLLTGIAGGIGMMTYMLLSWVMGVSEVHSFLSLLSRARGSKAVILEPAREVLNGGAEDKVA